MSDEKKVEFRFVRNAKVSLSKDKKWITHVLPDEKLGITFSVNYYRMIIEKHLQPEIKDEADKLPPQ